MARKADTPCAGCGRLLWTGSTSLKKPVCQPCRRARAVRTCEYEPCGVQFHTKTGHGRFCSYNCFKSQVQAATQRTCETCGLDYHPTRGQGRSTRYCSQACRKIATAATARPLLIWHIDCSECGRLFIARRPRQLTCGEDCRRRRVSRMTSESIKQRYQSDPQFRDLVISKSQNRRARLLGLERITQPRHVIAWLMWRCCGSCGICGKPVTAKSGPMRPSVDHTIPLSRGGKHEPGNLQLAHYRCNLQKRDRLQQEVSS
jgi:5-methylcytosine-specific restriction endonuclease McrA